MSIRGVCLIKYTFYIICWVFNEFLWNSDSKCRFSCEEECIFSLSKQNHKKSHLWLDCQRIHLFHIHHQQFIFRLSIQIAIRLILFEILHVSGWIRFTRSYGSCSGTTKVGCKRRGHCMCDSNRRLAPERCHWNSSCCRSMDQDVQLGPGQGQEREPVRPRQWRWRK